MTKYDESYINETYRGLTNWQQSLLVKIKRGHYDDVDKIYNELDKVEGMIEELENCEDDIDYEIYFEKYEEELK